MLQHQMATQSAIMRRASAELENRRRNSMGASRGLRSDGTLDPHYAAILFRDSRGVRSFAYLRAIQSRLVDTHLIYTSHACTSTWELSLFLMMIHILGILSLQLPVADPFLEKYNMSDSGKFPLNCATFRSLRKPGAEWLYLVFLRRDRLVTPVVLFGWARIWNHRVILLWCCLRASLNPLTRHMRSTRPMWTIPSAK